MVRVDPDRVIARHDFTPISQPNCIPLIAGESIVAYNRHPRGWWEGVTPDGSRGWFPSNFTEPLYSKRDDDHSVDIDPSVRCVTSAKHQQQNQKTRQHASLAVTLPPAMLHASYLLETAARAHQVPSYMPCVATLVSATREALDGMGCLQRSDPLVASSSNIAFRRRKILRELRSLAALTDRLGKAAATSERSQATERDDDDGAEEVLAHLHKITKDLLLLKEMVLALDTPKHAEEQNPGVATYPGPPTTTHHAHTSSVDTTPAVSPLSSSPAPLDVPLVRQQLEGAHAALHSALADFRRQVLAHSRAASPERSTQTRWSTNQPSNSVTPNSVSNVLTATVRTHDVVRKLLGVIEGVLGLDLPTVHPNSLNHVVDMRSVLSSASSHFLATVRLLTTNITSPNVSSSKMDIQRSSTNASVESVLAAASALSHTENDAFAAVTTLVAEGFPDSVAPSTVLDRDGPVSVEPEQVLIMDRASTRHQRVESSASTYGDVDAVHVQKVKSASGDGRRSSKSSQPLPSKTWSRLPALTRKVASLNPMKSVSNSASTNSSSSRSRHSSLRASDSSINLPTPITSGGRLSTDITTTEPVWLPPSPKLGLRTKRDSRQSSFSDYSGPSPTTKNFPTKAFSGSGSALQNFVKRALQGWPNGVSEDAPLDGQQDLVGPDNCMILDADQVVRNQQGDVLGATLAGLVSAVAPSKGEFPLDLATSLVLTMPLFTSAESVARLLLERYWCSLKGAEGDVQRSSTVEFARLWLSESYWHPAENQSALSFLAVLVQLSGETDLPSLVARRRAQRTGTGVMHIFPSPNAASGIQLRRVIDRTNGATLDELYEKPWVPMGASNTTTKLPEGDLPSLTALPPMELAQQLTILASRLWASVTPEEFLHAPNRKRSGSNSHRNSTVLGSDGEQDKELAGLPALSALSNKIVGLVAQEILSPDSVEDRGEFLMHFIQLSQSCLDLNNLHLFFAVQGGLACSSIRRLKGSWGSIPPEYNQMASLHAEVVDPARNHSAYRQRLDEAIVSGQPCIPFVGMALSDLTFTLEGNAPMRRALGSVSNATSSTASDEPIVEMVINWARYERVARLVNSLTATASRFYALQADSEVQVWLATVLRKAPESGSSAYDEELYSRSLVLEPRMPSASTSVTPTVNPRSSMLPLASPKLRTQSESAATPSTRLSGPSSPSHQLFARPISLSVHREGVVNNNMPATASPESFSTPFPRSTTAPRQVSIDLVGTPTSNKSG